MNERGVALKHYRLAICLGGIAWIAACGTNSNSPVTLAPSSATPTITQSTTTRLVFQEGDEGATVTDVALAAAVQNLPVEARDRDTLAAAATQLLRSSTNIDPTTLTPVPTATSINFATPADMLDTTDLAVLLAGSLVAEEEAEAIAAAATQILGETETVRAEDLLGIPGQTFPDNRGDIGGGALLVRDDAGVNRASNAADIIDELPSSTPAGGNVFFPPGTEILFPTAPDPAQALRVSYEPPLTAARNDTSSITSGETCTQGICLTPDFSDSILFTAGDLGCSRDGTCMVPDLTFVVPQSFVAEEDNYRVTYRFTAQNGNETVIERALSITSKESLDLASSLGAAVQRMFIFGPGESLTTATISGTLGLDLSDSSLTSVRGISAFTALQEWIANDNSISDLSPFAEFGSNPPLQSFIMGNNELSDLTPLANFTNLTNVFLSGNNISDISPLAGLSKIGTLFLDRNLIQDLSPIANLTQITELQAREIRSSGSALDVSPVASLFNIDRLDLSANNINDLTPLSNLSQLRILALGNNQIGNLSAIANLTNLEALGLPNNQIEDIEPLANLTNLFSLVIFDNQIRDIQPLSGLINLQDLQIANSQIEDFRPLANLTNLTQLAVEGTGISDLTPLIPLENISVLDLAFNNIESIAPLLNNPGLGSGDCVDLNENPLDDESINVSIPELRSRGVQVAFSQNDRPCELR